MCALAATLTSCSLSCLVRAIDTPRWSLVGGVYTCASDGRRLSGREVLRRQTVTRFKRCGEWRVHVREQPNRGIILKRSSQCNREQRPRTLGKMTGKEAVWCQIAARCSLQS
jgi:hypothetical protein